MDNINGQTSLAVYVKNLGIGYLAIVFLGLINTFIVKAGVYNVETFSETVGQYRIAQTIDVIMYCIVVWVAWASYMVTRVVKKGLALLALLFRFGEAILGCVAILFSMMVVVILGGEGSASALDVSQSRALAIMFMDLSNYTWNILFVLMGIGATLFMYLFLISKRSPSGSHIGAY